MRIYPLQPTLASLTPRLRRRGIAAAAALLALLGATPAMATVYGLQLLGEGITGGHVDLIPTKINDFGQVIGAASQFENGRNLGMQAFVTDIGATNFRYLVPSTWAGAATPFTTALDINNAGQVLGSTVGSVNGVIGPQYFLWNATSGVQALPPVMAGSPWMPQPMAWVDARAINDAGIVIGTVSSSPSTPGSGRPVAWNSHIGMGNLLPLQSGTPPVVASFQTGVVQAISNSNLVVGGLYDPMTGQMRSGTWNLAVDGALTVMTPPGGLPLPNTPPGAMQVRAVNDAGQAVGVYVAPGSSQAQAFFWDPVSRSSSVIPANVVPAGGGSVGTLTLAADGTVTGTLGNGKDVFTWKPGQAAATVIAGGAAVSVDVRAANNAGQAVGNGFGGWTGPYSSINTALLWQDGQAVDLNTLVTLPDGWRLTQAESINNRGQIAGIVRTPTGDLGFVLSPQGTAPSAPLLPEAGGSASAGWSFQATVQPDTPFFFDPDVAVGYEYEVRSGPAIKSVLLPANIGDGRYALWSWDGSAYVDAGIELHGGQTYTFAEAVTQFAVRGIETSAMLDPTSPTAFVTGLTFDGSGQVDLSQRAITEYVASVPEPGSVLMMLAGLAVLGGFVRRRLPRA